MNIKNITEISNRIYEHLADNESKIIFKERLLYSMTGDVEHIRNIIRDTPVGKEFYDLISDGKELYIFGLGIWGKDLVKVWPGIWKGAFDNKSSLWGKRFENIPVLNPITVLSENFIGKIVISSRIYYKEIEEQLLRLGIRKEQIINAGYLLEIMAKQQYFNLPYLVHDKNEVFVDVGSLDAMSSVAFGNWAKDKFDKIICFEPDEINIKKCQINLKKYGLKDKTAIIQKGAWSENKSMPFRSEGNGVSSLYTEAENSNANIDVTTMDAELKGTRVTFIKMDIEGAEYEALKGCEQIIREQHPKLAICIYHKPEDVLEIPQLILSYYPKCKFYLRHYSLATGETVLYVV